MVRVLNERYGFTVRGKAVFLLNRVLRIWPAYLVLLGLTLVALRFLPLTSVFSLIRMPATLAEIFTNLLLLGQVTFDFRQWIPMAKPLVTSWSLSVDMASYVLLALYFGWSAGRMWLYAGIGVAALVICGRRLLCWPSLFWPSSLTRVCRSPSGPRSAFRSHGVMLSCAPQKRVYRLEDFVGRASYHLFLGHMPLAAVLVTGLHFWAGSPTTFGVTVPLTTPAMLP